MSLMVEYLWSNITKAPCEGRELFPIGIDMFGTA